MRRPAFRSVIILSAFVFSAGVHSGLPASGAASSVWDRDFVYLYEGGEVVLTPSHYYAAALARGAEERGTAVTPPPGLELDPLSLREDLLERGVTLFRVPRLVEARGLEPEERPDAWTAVLAATLAGQPVFEQGAVLKIPADEVIVGFSAALSPTGVRETLSELWDNLAIAGMEELRPDTYLLSLRDAAAGRALEVSRALSVHPSVAYAEPNFVNIFLETPGGPPELPPPPATLAATTTFGKLDAPPGWRTPPSWERPPVGPDWMVLLDGHFEHDGVYGTQKQDYWKRARHLGATRVLPEVTKYRAHMGDRSVDMVFKGLAGRRPPGPYAEGIDSYVLSPPFSLQGFAEAYIELWFWARFEEPKRERREPYDFARLLLYDVLEGKFTMSISIAPVGGTGDLTQDSTSEAGWRRLLVRVPGDLRGVEHRLVLQFVSDGAEGAEGLYVDDLRVLASPQSDPPQVSEDPLAASQHALAPAGQVAGRPLEEDPAVGAAAAWGYGFSEEPALVALIDDGVEPNHPDLVAWAGDGTEDAPVSEEPLQPADRHGTACAGVIGAIADNGVGIAGVAPGTPLLSLRRGLDDLGIALAIDEAVGRGASVIVLPWGWTGAPSSTIRLAISEALEAGAIVLTASGDAGAHPPYSQDLDFPCVLGASNSLICVGAADPAGFPKSTSSSDGLYWWRSAASELGPDLLAPGTWLLTTDRRGPLGYNSGSSELPAEWTDQFGGTGAAACHVAGVAALMSSHDPLISPEEAKSILVESAKVVSARTTTRAASRLVVPEAAVLKAIELATERRRALLDVDTSDRPVVEDESDRGAPPDARE